jgi:hypothetical protein
MEPKDIVTLLGILVAAISLVFTAVNTRLTLRTNRARFWLDLRDRFSKHDTVHRLLRPGGAWAGGGGPSKPEEWADVEAYMGLFEHCEVMLEQKLIDQRTFADIYSYRLRNLVANDIVRQVKLIELATGWQRLLALLARMNIEVKR